MEPTTLTLALASPDGDVRQRLCVLRWPAHVAAEARAFIRDNLLAERVGDARKAEALLQRGRVSAAERTRFLAEKPFVPPEVSEALAAAVDLEDLVAEFSVALRAYRAAAPALELVFEWR
jgi:hypothetical protein